MPPSGEFIVIEGIDGSGKRTQLEALAQALSRKGIEFSQISFPNYEGFYGKLVARFLNGEFGPLTAVDPHFSAMLYAGDRLESRPGLQKALAAGKILLSDRYVASNLAHQGARVPREKRGQFLCWLRELEYKVYGLPEEDLVVYLRLPVTAAHDLIGQKAARDYTKLRRDLQEADQAHLAAAAAVYDELAREKNWVTIECMDGRSGNLRPAAEIHEEILRVVQAHLGAALGAKG
jgi:dTMP kinase